MDSAFAFQDLRGILVAFALFAFVYAIPGYVVSWIFDFFDFRQRLAAVRFVIGIVISLAISPILTFLTYYLGSVNWTFLLLGAFAIAFGVLIIAAKEAILPKEIRRLHLIAILIAVCWLIFCIMFLIDIQSGNRLYFNRVAYDFTTRVSIINAITRSGVPPINPSWYPGHPVRLTYLYYFWYIPCSLVTQLGGTWVDARAAMIASVAWCGLALVSTISLYLRLRNDVRGEKAWKSGILGMSVLLVSGLDLIPVLFSMRTLVLFRGDLEHWNEQITAWIGALSWVPHHIAAVIACVAAVMLMHWSRGRGRSKQLGAAVVAGLAFASGVGLSVFVTLIFVVFWGIWLIAVLVQKDRRLFLILILVGVIALIAASPFMAGFVTGVHSSAAGDRVPLALAVRIFTPIFPLASEYPPVLQGIIFLIFLPVSYAVELGFFFLAGLFWLQVHGKRRWGPSPYHQSELLLLAVSVFVASFVRSTAFGTNDLGWRAWLPGQFVLLIWGVDVIHRVFGSASQGSYSTSPEIRRMRLEFKAVLVIGLLTTVADVFLLRTWPMLEDAGVAGYFNRQCPDMQQGKRTLAARQAYNYINANEPQTAIVEPNPVDLYNIPVGLYLNRQIAVSGIAFYGISPDELLARALAIAEIFRHEDQWAQIDRSCKQYSIDLIVVTDQDPLWENLPVLAPQRKPVYQNAYYAVFPCGEYGDP